MSKGNSYWSTARGKIGDIVVSINKGQRIERAYQPVVNNPKTDAQMTQRAIFAGAVKFYKHAQQAFFKFAFEDKKQTESDYNAFMRHNRGVAMIASRSQYNDNNYPAIGNRFMLTSGSLSEFEMSDDPDNLMIRCGVPSSITENVTDPTVAQITECIKISNADLQDGDIITVVRVKSNIQDITDEPTTAPKWTVIQFLLDSTSTKKMSEVGFSNAEIQVPSSKDYADILFFETDTDHLDALGVVASRKTETGLLVNDTYLYLNDLGTTIYNDSLLDSFRAQALTSWGATGEAILEGSLVQ